MGVQNGIYLSRWSVIETSFDGTFYMPRNESCASMGLCECKSKNPIERELRIDISFREKWEYRRNLKKNPNLGFVKPIPHKFHGKFSMAAPSHSDGSWCLLCDSVLGTSLFYFSIIFSSFSFPFFFFLSSQLHNQLFAIFLFIFCPVFWKTKNLFFSIFLILLVNHHFIFWLD